MYTQQVHQSYVVNTVPNTV